MKAKKLAVRDAGAMLILDTVTALGNLQPKTYVDVGAQVSGQLMKIDVAVGKNDHGIYVGIGEAF